MKAPKVSGSKQSARSVHPQALAANFTSRVGSGVITIRTRGSPADGSHSESSGNPSMTDCAAATSDAQPEGQLYEKTTAPCSRSWTQNPSGMTDG